MNLYEHADKIEKAALTVRQHDFPYAIAADLRYRLSLRARPLLVTWVVRRLHQNIPPLSFRNLERHRVVLT